MPTNLVRIEPHLTMELMKKGNKKRLAKALKLVEFKDDNLTAVEITELNGNFIRMIVDYPYHATQEIEVDQYGAVSAQSIKYRIIESVPVQAFKLVALAHKLLNK